MTPETEERLAGMLVALVDHVTHLDAECDVLLVIDLEMQPAALAKIETRDELVPKLRKLGAPNAAAELLAPPPAGRVPVVLITGAGAWTSTIDLGVLFASEAAA